MKPPKNVKKISETYEIPTYDKFIAKTYKSENGVSAGRTVFEHCAIAGEIAKSLIDFYNKIYPEILPSNGYIPAKLHDVGKIYPIFAYKIYCAIDDVNKNDLFKPPFSNIELEKEWGGHAAVSYATLTACGAPASIARIVGAHHARQIKPLEATRESFGGKLWQNVRANLLFKLLGSDSWPEFDTYYERVIAGLTVVADWIASGSQFDDPNEDYKDLISVALKKAGYIWPTLRSNLTFRDIFAFDPRPIQKALYETVSGPGLYILEAPMGIGKTEAALYAAYRAMQRRKCTGIYFALPTCLTSNRIFYRLNNFLANIFEESPQAKLLHSSAWLELYSHQEMGAEGAPNFSWFDHGKRGILAPFAVGTIDQALFSVMSVKHGSLRTFGLTGKVVILDEVHTYDEYTGTLLDDLIEQLRHIGCTIIILSATLSEKRRQRLYNNNYGAIDHIKPISYPCIISIDNNNNKENIIDFDNSEQNKIIITHALYDKNGENQNAMEESLLRAEEGQRILWIENTVNNAQKIFKKLASRANAIGNIPVGLLHSRFTPIDRKLVEDKWTAKFAYNAPNRGHEGCILVGTQVVEQSLDLDADFLVSQICPSDMLFQRIGRLWRHKETNRPKTATREICLLHPDFNNVLLDLKEFKDSRYVYSPYVLFRSLEQWYNINEVCLPTSIRKILEATYEEREEKLESISNALKELNKQKNELRSYAMRAESILSTVNDEYSLKTRICDRTECSLLLLRSLDEYEKTLTLYSDDTIYLSEIFSKGNSWEIRSKIALNLMNCSVKIFTDLAPNDIPPKWISQLIDCSNLKIAIVGKNNELYSQSGMRLKNNLSYNSKIGIYFPSK